jgi:hypothetical protein
MEMESMGFTELELTNELQTSDSNIKQASIWLLQEADKNETESQGQILNDAWRKKRSKYKKYMSNICPFKVLDQMVVACPYIQRVQDLKSIYIYTLVADISVVEPGFLSKC